MSDARTTAINNSKDKKRSKRVKELSRYGISESSLYDPNAFPFLSKRAKEDFSKINQIRPSAERGK